MKISDSRKYPESNFKTAREWHIYHAFNDPKFIEQYDEIFLDKKAKRQKQLTEVDKAKLSKLADDFGLEVEDIIVYSGVPSRYGGGISRQGGWVWYDKMSESFIYRVSPDITRDGVVKLWKQHQAVRAMHTGQSRTKRKKPEDTELLYAIFKAKQKSPPLTFDAIFKLYQKGKLNYYEEGTTNWLNSVDSLKRYYYKYRPSTWLKRDT